MKPDRVEPRGCQESLRKQVLAGVLLHVVMATLPKDLTGGLFCRDFMAHEMNNGSIVIFKNI